MTTIINRIFEIKSFSLSSDSIFDLVMQKLFLNLIQFCLQRLMSSVSFCEYKMLNIEFKWVIVLLTCKLFWLNRRFLWRLWLEPLQPFRWINKFLYYLQNTSIFTSFSKQHNQMLILLPQAKGTQCYQGLLALQDVKVNEWRCHSILPGRGNSCTDDSFRVAVTGLTPGTKRRKWALLLNSLLEQLAFSKYILIGFLSHLRLRT